MSKLLGDGSTRFFMVTALVKWSMFTCDGNVRGMETLPLRVVGDGVSPRLLCTTNNHAEVMGRD